MTWLAVAAPIGLASSVARAAIVGALAEIGQRRAVTGPLAAAHLGLANLAQFALVPATLAIATTSIWFTSGAAIGLALAVVFLIVTLSDDDRPAPAPVGTPVTRVSIPTFLRSRSFWASAAVLGCAGIASVPSTLVREQLRAAHGGSSEQWAAAWTTPAITIAACGLYLLVSRRVSFRVLLRAALMAKAIALAAHALASRGSAAGTLDHALMVRDAGDALAAAAMLDLALRAAPRGREAFGAILLAGLPYVVMATIGTPFMLFLHDSAESVAWFAMAAAVASAIAVSLLPEAIVRPPDPIDRVISSPP